MGIDVLINPALEPRPLDPDEVKEVFVGHDGASVTLKPRTGEILTLEMAVFMLEAVKIKLIKDAE